jgi:hypothetical protein
MKIHTPMGKSPTNSTKSVRAAGDEKLSPRKRPPAPGKPIVVRLQPDQLAQLDQWRLKQEDIPRSHPDAIRRLINMVCRQKEEK